MSIPKRWDKEAHAEWQAGRKGFALKMLFDQLGKPGTPADIPLQTGYYLFLDGAYGPARDVLERAAIDYPENLPVLLNLAVLQDRTRDYAAERRTLERYLEMGGKEISAFDGLCTASHQLGDDAAAKSWGQRALSEKTLTASRLAEPIKLGEPRKTGRNIVSFSLWGDHPRYLRGALHNAIRARLFYPDFRCRFYVDGSVPGDLLEALTGAGSELIAEDGQPSTRHRLTRRFAVADDEEVALYLVRDCDSLVNSREAAAVGLWLKSDKAFHVMRDWWTHTDPMLAGMWGGRGGVLPPLGPLIESYRSKEVETPNWDQWFLRDRIWPSIRTQAMVHDRCFANEGSSPFPGPLPPRNLHVGQNEYAVRKKEQAAELARFKDKVPSLRL